ncbi:OmpA family protein [Lysobacter cavernae]|uniref:OmpA family protein n=1 Tax=Lysobacter cavernae TaxID=1685901 RepID=A0ABV7RPU8_9GAMM
MFNRILEQVAGRFGLSQEQARPLLGALVALIFNPKRGGPSGFIQAFRDRGLGDVVSSWLGHGTNQPISAAQLESVLGTDTLAGIGAKLGLPTATVGNAAAAMLPDAVDELSEHGDLPTSVSGWPEKLQHWFGGLGTGMDEFGQWGAAAMTGAGAAVTGARAADPPRPPVDAPARAGLSRWLPWLLIAAAIIAAFVLSRGCKREATAPVADTAPVTAPAPAATPAAQFDSRLVLTRTGDKVTYDGVVDSEATRSAITDALTKAFGPGNASGQLSIDPNARTPGWLAALAGFLPQFTANGATLTFEGNRVDLSGNLADADRIGLLGKLKAAFGGFSFGGLFESAAQSVGAVAERTSDAAAQAFDKLAPGKFSADDLVKALNLMVIHFETGSARISSKSDDILKKAADAIKAAPAGTRIEVGGHTDNTGNAAANTTLSQQRADAVSQRLGEHGVDTAGLSSKGYGQDKPVADNGTDAGRASNRRIEFTVLK